MIQHVLKKRGCHLNPTRQELRFWLKVDELREKNYENGYFTRQEERLRSLSPSLSTLVTTEPPPPNRIGQAEFIPFGRRPMIDR